MERQTAQMHQVKLLTILNSVSFVLLRLQLALFSYNKEISFVFLNKCILTWYRFVLFYEVPARLDQYNIILPDCVLVILRNVIQIKSR